MASQAESTTLSHRFLRSIGLDSMQANAKLNKVRIDHLFGKIFILKIIEFLRQDQQASISKFDVIVKEYYENCSLVDESTALGAVSSPSSPHNARQAALAPFQCQDTAIRVHKTVGEIEAGLGVVVLRIMTSNERPVHDIAEHVMCAYRAVWAVDGAASAQVQKTVEAEPDAAAPAAKDGPPQSAPLELGRSLDSLNFLLSGLTKDAIEVLASCNASVSTR